MQTKKNAKQVNKKASWERNGPIIKTSGSAYRPLINHRRPLGK